MKTVWKFPVPLHGGDRFTIAMPAGAKALAMQTQHGMPALWALVDPGAAPEPRRFRIAGTGHPIDEEIVGYVGTFQMSGGVLVFHVFEVKQ